MSFTENKRAAIESRLGEARPRIVEQYERIRDLTDACEIQLNATVLVNMLLVFNFMSLTIDHTRHKSAQVVASLAISARLPCLCS